MSRRIKKRGESEREKQRENHGQIVPGRNRTKNDQDNGKREKSRRVSRKLSERDPKIMRSAIFRSRARTMKVKTKGFQRARKQ